MSRALSAALAASLAGCMADTTNPTPPGGDDAGATGADSGGGGGGADAGNTTDPDGGAFRFHPVDYAAPAVHGLELKTGPLDCRNCHGGDLTGGTGPSCDSCHQGGAAWRTNCTYCHGGTDGTNGAPPRDLRGATARDMLSFRPHTEHTSVNDHAAWDCDQCHNKPTDALSGGHIFDDTRGTAEVIFGNGLSPQGQYSAGSCSSLYCHGTGRGATGTIEHTAAKPACDGCHPGVASTTRWVNMSGEHRKHMREGIKCGECHGATTDVAASTTITNPDNHVNGQVDFAFNAAGFTRSETLHTCTGTCHNERHIARSW